MENDSLTFTLNGILYQIDPHIWRDHPNRIGLITVERIIDAIQDPDVRQDETAVTTLYWKWFPELGSGGNYIKVVVERKETHREITTSHPDSRMRRGRGAP